MGDLQQRLARPGGLLFHGKAHVSAHHHAGELLFRGFGNVHRADALTLAQDGASVGHRHDFVELVRDKENALSLPGKAAHDLHQLVDFLRREHGGGLVEDKDLIVPVKHFQDFHPLLHAHRNILDERVRVHPQAILLG
ncbi:hypothetical protein SDC9_199330 [bioreactor metagenome]|uniref:Uncharacterized protein n=1 Tax=bioreactor metagenome TaxID=1076179 RepID=A0A645IK65_9ZZZZ